MGRSSIPEPRPAPEGIENGSAREGRHAAVPVGNGSRAFPAASGRYRWFDIVGLCILVVIAVVVRFWTRSDMWLDEALTVNIAKESLGQIPTALKHDGHPPLYYVLLHFWMSVFGESDRAIRALPAVFGTLMIPAGFLVGRRIGGRTVAWCTAVLIAVSPFAIRYSTENRMYSLIMLVTLLGWLCADSALRRVRPMPLIGLALCTSVLLWSQYWALWLGMAAAGILVWRIVDARRNGRPERIRPAVWTLGALAVGAISFLPWLPTMFYQQAHTGTPWATRSMPPTVIVTTIQTLGGASSATTDIGGWVFTAVMLVGLFGVGVASGRIDLDLRTRVWARPLAWLAGTTLLIGLAAMVVSNTAFQPRYNAVWLPFAFVIGGIGVAVLRGPVLQRGALALVVLASVSGIHGNITDDRSQAAAAAREIDANAQSGDIVAVCPDQLGPALDRVLRQDLDVGTFPDFSDPRFVDWSDYAERNASVSPEEFATRLADRAGDDKRIFVVWSETYTTHRTTCTEVVRALTGLRPNNRQILEAKRLFFESENVTGFWPGPIP